MSIEAAKMHVTIGANSSGLKQELEDAKNQASRVIKDLQAVAFGIFGSVALFGRSLINQSIDLAEAAQEIRGTYEHVYKGMVDDADAFVDEFAKALGRSKSATQSQLVDFQTMWENLRLTQDAAFSLSTQMMELAEDFGAVYNESEQLAQSKLKAAIQGNTAALSKYGIVIRDWQINQELARMGTGRTINTATDQQRAIARLNLVMAQSTDIMGQGRLQSERFSNQGRRLEANITAIKVAIGDSLIPVWHQMRNVLGVVTGKMLEFIDETGDMVPMALAGATAISALATSLTGAGIAARFFGISLRGALIGSGIGIAVVALGAAVGALVGWFSNLADAGEKAAEPMHKLTLAWERLHDTGMIIFNALADVANNLLAQVLPGGAEQAEQGILGLLDTLTEFALDAAEWIQAIVEHADQLWNEMPEILQYVLSYMYDIWENGNAYLLQLVGYGLRQVYDKFVEWGKMLLDNWTNILMLLVKASVDIWTGGEAAMEEIKRLGARMGNALIDGWEGKKPDFADIFDESERTKKILEGIEVFGDIGKRKRELEGLRRELQKGEEEAGGETPGKQFGQEAAQAFLDFGRMGFVEYGNKIQDALLKSREEDLNAEQLSVLQKSARIQDEMLQTLKKPQKKTGGLK